MKTHLNLIPPATQRRMQMRRVVRVWSTSMVLSGACAGLLLGAEWLRGMAALRELAELDARFAPFAELMREQDSLAERVAQLRSREQLSLRLSHQAHGVAALAAIADAARAGGGSVYVRSLEYAGERDDAAGSVRLEGAGVDGVAVAAFAESLRSSGVFAEVAVESTGPLPGGTASLRRFDLACRF